MVNVKEWAEDQLPDDYPAHDDVPLTEDERNRAIDLLLSLNVAEAEDTNVVLLRNTDIEVLQTGLFVLHHVLRDRHDRYIRKEMDEDVGREVLDSMRNVRHLYNFLETKKEKEIL